MRRLCPHVVSLAEPEAECGVVVLAIKGLSVGYIAGGASTFLVYGTIMESNVRSTIALKLQKVSAYPMHMTHSAMWVMCKFDWEKTSG